VKFLLKKKRQKRSASRQIKSAQ